MKTINSLHDLLIHNIKTLYDAEHQLTEILPLINERVSHPDLKRIVTDELEAANKLSAALKDVGSEIGEETAGQISESMVGLSREIRYFFNEDFDNHTVDAAILNLLQQVCHYTITLYGATSQYAEILEMDDIKSLLGKNIVLKRDLDKSMKTLAVRINEIAVDVN